MVKLYPVVCSSCAKPILAPFPPPQDIELECPACQMMHTDMTKSKYVANLTAFLSQKLHQTMRDFVIKAFPDANNRSNIAICTRNGIEVVGIINWIMKNSIKLIRPGDKILAEIKMTTKMPEIKEIIKEFIKKYGIEADIPAPTR